ncbi:MAG: hypothetical protein WCG76_06900 [Verrucomicrobiota bacterium]
MKIGLVTIVIGPKYTELFDEFSRARFENYACRHGYETLVVDRPIRELPGKKLTWQKCCLHDLEWVRSMDMVAFLDSDILIAKDAPALPLVEPGKIGGVMDKPPAGLNSGVLLFRPGKEVAAMFEEALLDPDPFWDQVAIDRVLRKNNALQLIDPRFHCMFYVRSRRIFRAVFGRNWIYHSLHGKSKLTLISRLLALQGR